MIKKLTIYYALFLVLIFTGCAQEDWLLNPNEAPDRDYAEISFAVSEPQRINTRAYNLSDGTINNATILIYSYNEDLTRTKLLQSYSSESQTTLRVEYEDEVKSLDRDADLYLFAVANHDFGSDIPQTVSELLQKTDGTDISQRTDIIMAGCAGSLENEDPKLTKVKKADLNSAVTIILRRNLSRAVVKTNETAAANFNLTEYNIWSGGSKGYVVGGVSRISEGISKGTQSSVNKGEAQTPSEDEGKPNYVYAYPQAAPTSNIDKPETDNRAFVIVGGEYLGEKCYYRIDLRKKDEDSGKYTYLFLTPNYQYDITITKVKCKGYATAEEAAKHPQADYLEAEIHEHVPAVLSMTSDGVRELGVALNAQIEGSQTSFFTMKLFSSVSESEYPAEQTQFQNQLRYDNGEGFSLEVIEGKEWLKLTGFANENPDDTDSSGESADGGKIYHVGMKAASNYSLGTLEGKVLVTWRGLTREVRVTWTNDFAPSDLCSAVLRIKYKDSTAGSDESKTSREISNYWEFIANNDGSNQGVYGVAPEMNDGNIRNQGLHFPLYYGGRTDGGNWEYEYVLKLSDKVMNGRDGQNISARISADGNVLEGWSESDIRVNKEDHTITIRANSLSFGRAYATGNLIITIGDEELPAIEIYRTGFFHNVTAKSNSKSPLTHEISGKSTSGMYYYEVRSFGNRLWLDRNVCATSGGMAIITSEGNQYITNSLPFNNGAVGGYFKPAKAVDYGKVEENIYTEICPPGFRIPNTTEWDIIRNSVAFNTDQTVTDGKTYYQSNLLDDNGNMLYLPKVMYYNAPENATSSLVGDSQNGYYWTKSEAPGLEKNQIGHWMRALVLSGRSNSYMHGNVGEYGMQIRAIDAAEEVVNQTTIGFTVVGATHVYVYDAGEPYGSDNKDDKSYHDDIKSGLMTWPGQAIGEWNTMRALKVDGRYINPDDNNKAAREFTFTYTTNTDKRNLRFVFAYVKDGKIYVFSRGVNNDETGASKYEGWPLLSSYKFSLNISSGTWSHELSGDVLNPNLTEEKYKFFFKKNPTTWDGGKTDNDPLGFKLIADNSTIAEERFANLTPTKIGDTDYYVVDYVSTKENFTWKSSWGFWHNTGNRITYTGETDGTVSDFTWSDKYGAMCIIFDRLSGFKSGAPDDSGPVSNTKNYRIYFPDNSTKMHMWWTDGSKNYPFLEGKNSMEGVKKDGSYYYLNFEETGNEDKQIRFARQGTNSDWDITDRNFTLSQFKYEDEVGRYCAYIDTDNNFHAGKPQAEWDHKSYRLYVKDVYGSNTGFNSWFSTGGNGVLPPKGLLSDTWWTGSYSEGKYIDITVEGDFTLQWEYVSDAKWENGNLAGNKGGPFNNDRGSMTNNDFNYDVNIGKKVYTINNYNSGVGKAPVRRKPASSKSSKRSR